MRVLNLEDSPIKHRAIRDVLEQCRVTEVDRAMYLDEGLKMYKDAIAADRPYDLIITDMWYPQNRGEHEQRSGDKLVSISKEEKWDTPILICSNQNYSYPEILGCLYYSENEDWEGQLRNYIEQIMKTRKK